jgi:hypothetical protein
MNSMTNLESGVLPRIRFSRKAVGSPGRCITRPGWTPAHLLQAISIGRCLLESLGIRNQIANVSHRISASTSMWIDWWSWVETRLRLHSGGNSIVVIRTWVKARAEISPQPDQVSVNKSLRIDITRDIWKSHLWSAAQMAECEAADRNEFKRTWNQVYMD